MWGKAMKRRFVYRSSITGHIFRSAYRHPTTPRASARGFLSFQRRTIPGSTYAEISAITPTSTSMSSVTAMLEPNVHHAEIAQDQRSQDKSNHSESIRACP